MIKILHFGIGSIFPCSWIKQPTVLTEHVPWDDAVRRPFLPRIQKILGLIWQWNKKAKTTSHPGEYWRRVGNDCLILGDSIDPRCLNMGDSRWQRWGYAGGRVCATAMERLTSRFTQMVTLLNKSRSLCNMPLERSKTQSCRTRWSFHWVINSRTNLMLWQ